MMDRALYEPSPWAQKFHQTTQDEVLGGGSAGPGKSLTLLFDPLVTQARVEHMRMTGEPEEGTADWLCELIRKHPIRRGESEGHAIHMRRTMPQLRETLDRAHRMFKKFDPDVQWNSESKRFTFSSGFKYTFGHCKLESDYEDYLSQQYTHLGIDEAYQFTLRMFEELDARVRSADPVLILLLRSRLMSNPAPGWLKERFVDPEPKGNVELKYRLRDPATGEERFKTRMFLPAKLDDNPDKAFVAEYKFKLLSKPAHIRARYLYGDWNSMEGGYFEDDWNPAVHVIKAFKIPRAWPKFRSMDWGFKAPGVMGWLALDPEENLYLFYEYNFRMTKDEQVCDTAIEVEKAFGFWDERQRKSRLIGVADTQLWEERGDSGKSKAQVFHSKGMFWQPADKASMERNAERLSERLRDYDQDRPPALMVFENCKKTIEMFSGIQVDENNSLVPDKKSPLKHWFDMIAYGAARASRGGGSIPMDDHVFDRFEDEEAPVAATGSFGYGT